MPFKNERVWFVGSNPSRMNDSPDVPFQGTRSWMTLLGWIAVLDLSNYSLINVSNKIQDGKINVTKADFNRIENTLKGEKFIIALGNIASTTLQGLEIPHFKLPHPSPRNRKLNDPAFIDRELARCKEYLEKV